MEEIFSKYKQEKKSNEEEVKTLQEELYMTRQQMMASLEEVKSLKRKVVNFKKRNKDVGRPHGRGREIKTRNYFAQEEA